MTGTLVNTATIVIGGLLGLTFRNLLSEKSQETLMQGVGLFVLLYGVKQFLGGQEFVLILLAMIIGGLIGSWIDIDGRIKKLEGWLEARFSATAAAGSGIGKGFIYASLVFGIGPMAITGAIADGLSGDSGILLTKAVIDGIAATAFAAALGPGVLLSALTIFVYQGGITLLAASVQNILPGPIVLDLTAVGGMLVFGIGVNMLGWKPIRVPNFLPALFAVIPIEHWAPAVIAFFSRIF
ncbi:MAG: DUF554 domain-containing protein [Bacillota bacterium]|mgnify:CR=1 FL=1